MKRNLSIDIARGIGILLVVLLHSWFADTRAHPDFRNSLATFLMPLFFLVSGLFLNVSARPASFLKVRADALLKPCFGVLLAVWSAYAAKDILTGEATTANLARDLAKVFYATGPILSIPPLWFLPLLFLASVLCYLLARAVPGDNPRRLLLGAAVILLIAGLPSLRLFWGLDGQAGARPAPGLDALPGLPWSLDILPIATAFMLAGYALRDSIIDMRVRLVPLFLAAALFLGLRLTFDQSMDLNLRRFDDPLIVTLQAAAGIFLILGLSVWLRDFPRPSAVLIYVGQGSLFILLFHYHIQRVLFAHLLGPLGSPWIAATLAYVAAAGLPLLMWEVTKRNDFLSLLLLPSRRPRSLAPIASPGPVS